MRRKLAHAPAAVDAGRLVVRAVDALEPGQEDGGEVADVPPGRRDDQAPERQAGVRQPARALDAEAPQHLVQQAVLGIEDPQPDDPDRHDRRHGRQVGDRAIEPDLPELLVQQQRRRQGQDHDAGGDAEREEGGLEEAPGEGPVLERAPGSWRARPTRGPGTSGSTRETTDRRRSRPETRRTARRSPARGRGKATRSGSPLASAGAARAGRRPALQRSRCARTRPELPP